MPKLRHHKPSGRAVVTLSNRDVRLGAFGSPEAKRNYDAAVAEWLANGRLLPAAAGPGATVAELVAGYREHAANYYRFSDGTPTSEPGNIDIALRPLLALYCYRATEACRQSARVAGGWPRVRNCSARVFAWEALAVALRT